MSLVRSFSFVSAVCRTKSRSHSVGEIFRKGIFCDGSIFGKRMYSTPQNESDESPTDLPIAKLSRSLVQLRISGTFCSVNVDKLSEGDGRPAMFCTLMPYVSDERGNPIIKLDHDEDHFKHLQRYGEASMIITPLCPRFINPNHTPIPRLNLITTPEDVTKFVGFVDMFQKTHPKSKDVHAADKKYSYIRLNVDRAIWKSSTSVTTDLDVFAYRGTELDPILSNARPLLIFLNDSYRDWIQKFTKSSEAFIYLVDHQGFNVLARTGTDDEWQDNRILFEAPVQSEDECRWRIESLLQPH
eukprot:TRINITY_DN5469_c0_g1_i3.p1 TRINITY_DN5469_c0_g1~~TRINITY_DN5469_c0_g1_i3.p1  ORF type:complete len:299 (+),score=53.13 TRINITY_DN5469_c0_g1_i3:56-952(+)